MLSLQLSFYVVKRIRYIIYCAGYLFLFVCLKIREFFFEEAVFFYFRLEEIPLLKTIEKRGDVGQLDTATAWELNR